MAQRPAKTIYFISGDTPTQEDYKAAEDIGRGVVFRNAQRIVPGAPLENADAVAGAVPPDYAAVYGDNADGDNPRILLRPHPTRTASSGGPDDIRPGTIDDGLAHESGVGSNFSGPAYAERAATVARAGQRQQRQGAAIWEKNPERALEPATAEYGSNVQRGQATVGAWPTVGTPATANVQSDLAPNVAGETAEGTSEAMQNAWQQQQDQEQQQREQREQEQQREGTQTSQPKSDTKADDKKGGKSK